MAWRVEQVRPIGSIAPTTSSSLSTQGVSGNGVVLISFQLASLASLEVIVGPEANGKDISVLSVQTNGDFIFSSDTGGQVFVTPVTGTGYKSLSFDNTTGSVYNVGIWIHATTAGTAIGSVPVYYACHNYNQYYVLNTESITVTKSTGTVMINQTGLSNCFKRQVQKIAATIPAQCLATFYSGNTNVETGANIDVYGYSASTSVGISESTGAPTSFLTSDDNSQGNGQWKLTYSNTTNSAVTIYLYSKTSSNANRFATIYYSGEAISSGSWSEVAATLNVPTSAGNYATTSISTLGAGKYLNATFTPAVTGTYQCWSRFAGDAYMFIGPTTMSVSNTNGAVTGATTLNDDGANNAFGSGNYGSNQPFCEISLTANTTYRMVIRHYSSTSSPTSSIGAGTVYIGLKIWHRAQNMSSSTSLTSFTAGTPKTLVASAGDIANGTYYIYPFTVDTTGQYYIASGTGTISGDTYGFISTTQSWIAALTGTTRTLRSGNILASDDDGNTSVASNQYKITVNLDAGTTYYLYHMGYNTSSTSSGNPITVTLVSGGSGVNKAYIASGSLSSSTWISAGMDYPAYVIGKGTPENTVLNPQSINTINFVLSYTPTGTELGSWDASEDVDGSITAYALADGKTLVVAKTSNSSDKIYYKDGSTCVLTTHMYNVTNITGCSNIDTSGVGWFYYTLTEYSGTSVPSGIENWDVSSATHFDGFFWNCTGLTNIVLYWNTASAVNMSGLFYNCSSAQNIQIPNLDTRHCTNLGNMFEFCRRTRSITVGSYFTRMGSGSTNLTNFPNPAAFYGTVPAGSVVIDKWRNTTTNVEYTYDNIPNLTAATYVLYGDAPEYHSVWKLYNGTEWVIVYPQVYNGSSWVPLKGMAYDATDNEWK